MPYKSQAEERWAHTPSGEKALGASGVKEWDQASKGLKLPKKVTEHDTHFIAHMADGGEVKIAKKGLGPKVLHRLTGMAMAAPQVQRMADGGDVVDMGDATEVPQPPRIDIPAHVLSQGEVDRALGTDTVPSDESGAGEATLTGEAPSPAVGLPAPAAAPAIAPKVGGGGFDSRKLDAAEAQKVKGAQEAADVQARLGQQEAAVLQQHQDAMIAKQAIHDEEAKKIQAQIAQTEDDIKNTKIDPNHFYNSKSTGGKIGAILGLALGGLGGGMARGPNVALAMLNKQIDQDLEAQKENLGKKNNLVSLYYKKLGNLDEATQRAKADMQAAVRVKLDQYGALAKGDVAQANVTALKGALAEDALKTGSDLATQAAARRLSGIHAAIGEQQLAASGANTQQAEQVRQIQERLYAGKGTAQDQATLDYLTGGKGSARIVQTVGGGRAYAHDDKTAEKYREATYEAIPAINNIDRLQSLVKEIGVGTLSPTKRGELTTRINSLAQTLPKAASGLTRVTGAEIEVALKTLGNPNSPFQTQARSLAVLRAYKDELSDRVGTAADQYLIKPGADRSEVTQIKP